MKRFVIIGLGNFGSAMAEALTDLGHEVVALDRDEQAVDHLGDRVTQAAVGDGTEVEVLERMGAGDSDAAIICTGGDISASVLATLALRDCGVEAIYVKATSHNHARVLEKWGVRETIFPERDTAQRLARRLAAQKIVNFLDLGPGFSAQEMAVPQPWVGKSLRQLELPRNFQVSVIAIHDHLRDSFTAIPDPDAPLTDSDSLLVAGADEHLEQLERVQ
jgi:trk system potassium uptake protein TrkA